MTVSERAGRPADPSILVDVDRLVDAYYVRRPDPAEPTQRVAFGTSGHRGSAFNAAFNEAHIVAIAQREGRLVLWVNARDPSAPIRLWDLDGWTVKVAKHPLGVNHAGTLGDAGHGYGLALDCYTP